MIDQFYIEAQDEPGLLWAVLDEFGEGALISLEGELQETGVMKLPGASPDETKALRRQTRAPRQDFVVLPVSKQTVDELRTRLCRPGIFGEMGRLVHVQIEANNERVFIACDNFHRECTWLKTTNGRAFLDRLRDAGIVRGFSLATRSHE